METTITISTEEYRELIAASVQLTLKPKLDELENKLKETEERNTKYVLKSIENDKRVEALERMLESKNEKIKFLESFEKFVIENYKDEFEEKMNIEWGEA